MALMMMPSLILGATGGVASRPRGLGRVIAGELLEPMWPVRERAINGSADGAMANQRMSAFDWPR